MIIQGRAFTANKTEPNHRPDYTYPELRPPYMVDLDPCHRGVVRCFDSEKPEILDLRVHPDLIKVSKQQPLDMLPSRCQLARKLVHAHLWHMFDLNSSEGDRLRWFDDEVARWFCHNVPFYAAFLAMRAITHRISSDRRCLWVWEAGLVELDELDTRLNSIRSPASPLFALVMPSVEASMHVMNHFVQMGWCSVNKESAPLTGRTAMHFKQILA